MATPPAPDAGSPSRERDRSPVCDPEDRAWLLAAAILASALGFIDGSVVSIALPAIRESLGAGLREAQWVSNAYLIPLSALILAGGALADRFGLVRVFALGIGLFLVASAATALAPTPEALIAARAAKGVGAALMVPGSLALVARAYPRSERGRAIGLWAAASALTTAAGPVLGGLALSLGGPEMWRWVFAVNLPVGAVTLWILRARAIADPGRPGAPVDWAGAALATAGLGGLAFGLTQPGQGVWALAGLAVLGLFIAWEARSPAPMMPLGLFGRRVFAAANLLTFALYFALSAMLFFLPMGVIAGWGVSEFSASLAFLPLTLLVGGLSRPVGRLADEIGPARPILGGTALVAAGYALFAATVPAMAYWSLVLPAMTVAALGMALVVAPLSTAVMGAVTDAESGTASGINNAVSRMAGLVAVAAMGSVAAAAYARAGGTESFGAAAPGAAHLDGTNAALSAVGWASAALAAISGVVGWIGLGRQPPAQASSSASQ